MKSKPVVLTCIDYYLPGYKAGGPIRTIANMVESLGDEFAFFVLTSNHDFKSDTPYGNFVLGTWQTVGKAQVMYLPPAEKRWWRWRRWLAYLDYDVIYLNSCFSSLTVKTLLLRRLSLIPRRPVILAPRGEFSPGALGLKKLKKILYLILSQWLNLYEGAIFQASSNYEQQDIIHIFGERAIQVIVAPDFVLRNISDSTFRLTKDKGGVRIVFLSRISRKKNLDYALQILNTLSKSIIFDIYGPIEDAVYWQECQSMIKQMPANICVTYQGEVAPEHVEEVFSQYHLFLFPTRGENFGHVISESLRAGCPVLISDQTPWQGLEEKKAGWVVSLSHPEQFQSILDIVIEMDKTTFQEWSDGARVYGEQHANDPTIVEANRQLFMNTLKLG